ncbi:MAG: GNAT family N-acetyltransferase, partial [Verrucomicrobiota bacterium]
MEESAITLRHATTEDRDEIASLIYLSTNFWYAANGKAAIFQGEPSSTRLFCDVYEDLDPGHCIIAVDEGMKRIVGSCFYHPRETHVSLGIMNSHPNYGGKGVARRLLKFITDFADKEGKPVRLVSSAMNLDSFSLYNRAGFLPYSVFQDMILEVPKEGIAFHAPDGKRLRDAKREDVPALQAL